MVSFNCKESHETAGQISLGERSRGRHKSSKVDSEASWLLSDEEVSHVELSRDSDESDSSLSHSALAVTGVDVQRGVCKIAG